MTQITWAYLMIVFCVACLSVGQIMFKVVSGRIESLASLANDPYAGIILCVSLGLYGISTLVWILALKVIPLSQAYLFMALGFVIVPLAAYFVFGEPLSKHQIIGSILVIGGLVVATR
ncbi:EamA family transporter [Rhodopseudomonas sp. G2_2311]|uniref:EamA family transporter n=1 Tax=Rhodopseudomonas sp. G2_2311 TaxID=3114287 RepID=UPI0039C66665